MSGPSDPAWPISSSPSGEGLGWGVPAGAAFAERPHPHTPPLKGRGFGIAILAATSAAPAVAQPAPLCGITAPDIAGYRAAVAADPRFKRNGGDGFRETWTAESIQAIWSFTNPKNPVHPAALCEEVIDKDGAMRIERRSICEAGAADCAKLDAEIKSREDSSGDGE